ncbi:cilia-and flagella-associated protein 96 isoform X7 [Chelonoidis abingdonii]|uniref:cilia-and flagella-associated protein 96 isoform X7 n=1 Tax=Chelonoidis abingdonii TaxID=106734 RepID=UPI003F4928CD
MPAEGKTDMERIGLFSEMEYVTIGDKYASHYMRTGSGWRTTKAIFLLLVLTLPRLLLGVDYIHPDRIDPVNTGSPLVRCGMGTYYGTIGGPYPFFSAQLRGKTAYAPPGKNLYTSPGKKGTGYGYPNLTIGKQYPHSSDVYESGKMNAKKAHEDHLRLVKGGPFKLNLYPREYFDLNPYYDDKPLPPAKKPTPEKPVAHPFKPSSPAKKSGGMKAGTFDPYPSHSAEPYVVKYSKLITTNKEGRIFHPPPGSKSRPSTSIMALNVARSLNVMNYKTTHLIY